MKVNKKLEKWLRMQLIWAICISIVITANIGVIFAENEYIMDYEDEYLWTLRLIAHSTEYGSTTASASQSWSNGFIIGPFSNSSTITHHVTLSPSGCVCAAEFRRCKWRWEYVLVGPLNGHYYEDRWRIISSYNDYHCHDVHGAIDNCKNDVESFTYDGYDSIEFESQYVSSDASYSTQSTPISYTRTIKNYAYFIANLGVEVPVGNHVGIGTVGVKNIYGSSVTYIYTFNPSNHAWYVDYHGSTGHLWTFDNRW